MEDQECITAFALSVCAAINTSRGPHAVMHHAVPCCAAEDAPLPRIPRTDN